MRTVGRPEGEGDAEINADSVGEGESEEFVLRGFTLRRSSAFDMRSAQAIDDRGNGNPVLFTRDAIVSGSTRALFRSVHAFDVLVKTGSVERRLACLSSL